MLTRPLTIDDGVRTARGVTRINVTGVLTDLGEGALSLAAGVTTTDGTHAGAVTSITFPAGTISVSAGVATYTPTANVTILSGSVDPSAGGGVTATAPALYLRLNAAATEIWMKTSAPATGWTKNS